MHIIRQAQHATRSFLQASWLILMSCTLLGLSACGGGGMDGTTGDSPKMSTSACAESSCGGAMLSMTDAEGDFLTYTVDVTSLTLQRANGTVVETLPMKTRIDFATLVNLSEIISSRQIPAGSYTSVKIGLDYTNANIVVNDGTSAGKKLAAVDDTGAAVGKTTLSLQLESGRSFVVTPGKVAHMGLDFNLLASNTVNLSTAKVTVNPILIASLEPATTKQMRVRGPLVSVDTSASTYTINVRPFHNESDSTGEVVVHTTSTTTFAIDGTSYVGSAGLTKLATVAKDSLVVAYGTLSKADQSFTAANVLAGTSVGNGKMDSVEGDVIARSGNVLTLRGATLCHKDGRDFDFERGDIAVTVSDVTTVFKDGSTGSFTIKDISVGQHVQIFGIASESSGSSSSSSSSSSTSSSSSSSASSGSSSSSSASSMTMMTTMLFDDDDDDNNDGDHHDRDDHDGRIVSLDATTGSARLIQSSLWGTVNSKSGNSVTVDLQALNGRLPTAYNFAGTGATPAENANPDAYVVGTSTLDISGVTTGAAMRFLGFVAPFGSITTGGSAFNATTLVNYATTNAVMLVQFGWQGVTTPFATLNSAGLSITKGVLAATERHFVWVGPQRFDLSTLSGGVKIVPSSTATTIKFVIGHSKSHKIENFPDFTAFVAALTTDLNGVTRALGVTAEGSYNNSTGTLTATLIIVALND